MAESRVVNTSPLIFLAGAGLLDLLRPGEEPVHVPKAVGEEINRKGTSDPAARAHYLSDRVLEMALAHVGESRSNP